MHCRKATTRLNSFTVDPRSVGARGTVQYACPSWSTFLSARETISLGVWRMELRLSVTYPLVVSEENSLRCTRRPWLSHLLGSSSRGLLTFQRSCEQSTRRMYLVWYTSTAAWFIQRRSEKRDVSYIRPATTDRGLYVSGGWTTIATPLLCPASRDETIPPGFSQRHKL